MRDKIRVGGDKMSVVDASIADARSWSDFLLSRTFRGPGDTIERAAYEAEQTYGAPASILLRLRRREVTDMLLSNWIRLKNAKDAAVLCMERAAQHQEELARAAGINESNSRLFKAAVLLDGTQDRSTP